MPLLSLLSFDQFVQSSGASAQAGAGIPLDLSEGSIGLALLEANAAIATWVQNQAFLVLQAARLSTAVGADVDLWVADFGLVRTAAVAATGFVTLSRAGNLFPSLVPVGMQVVTTDGSQTYAVTADPTNALYVAGLTGYSVPIGTTSITVPVVASVAGIAGNVLGGAISLLTSAIPGIDSVTNALPLSSGQDAETDAALKARFQVYLAGLAEGTETAIAAAILGVQPGLSYSIAENVDETGAKEIGHFVVTIDDGSGSPPASLLTAVYLAVDARRALGTTFSVQAPTIMVANITLTITVAQGVSKAITQGIVAAAVVAYVDGLGIGDPLPYSIIGKIAYDSVPGGQITNVSGILINGQFGDFASLVPGPSGAVRIGQVVVN